MFFVVFLSMICPPTNDKWLARENKYSRFWYYLLNHWAWNKGNFFTHIDIVKSHLWLCSNVYTNVVFAFRYSRMVNHVFLSAVHPCFFTDSEGSSCQALPQYTEGHYLNFKHNTLFNVTNESNLKVNLIFLHLSFTVVSLVNVVISCHHLSSGCWEWFWCLQTTASSTATVVQ